MLNRIQKLFELITEKVENNPAGFRTYLKLFFALLVLRLTLEFFSSQRLFTKHDILHIGFWFIFIVLTFLLQLHLFSGEPILKISKLVITFFVIALVAPLVDLAFYQGQGAKMNYLSLHNWKQALWSYFTMGGSNINRGATIGIRVEIFLLVAACFNYVRTKRNSIAIGLLAAWSIYTILFLSGVIPILLGVVVNRFGLQYQDSDQSTVLLLLTLDLILILIAFHRFKPDFLNSLIKHIKLGVFVCGVFCFLIGVALARVHYADNWTLTPTTLFWFPLGVGLSFSFTALILVYTIKPDTEENIYQNPIVKNLAIFFIILIASFISYQCFFTACLSWSIIYLHYEKPFEFSRIFFVRNLNIGLIFTSFAILGFCTFQGPMIGFPLNWILILFVNSFACSLFVETIQNVKQIAGGSSVISLYRNMYFRILVMIALVLSLITILILLKNLNTI